MKIYQKPIVCAITLTTNDVITVSLGNDPSSNDLDWKFTSLEQ